MKACEAKLRTINDLQYIFCKVAQWGSVVPWQRARLSWTSSISVR